MKILLYYLGLVLELIGLSTMMVVIILFFGEAKMGLLLKMFILAGTEFYGGYWLVRTFKKKTTL